MTKQKRPTKDDIIKAYSNEIIRLIEWIKSLRKQLNEANEVIKFYSDAHQLSEEEKQMTGEKYHLVYGLKANDYLEKWGVR